MKTVYKEKGYEDRDDYLRCVSEDYDVDIDVVKDLADLLGPNEDFDGLVAALQDVSE
jgi:hypothetical protein